MKVFIPVSVNDELPAECVWVVIITKEHDEICAKRYSDTWKVIYSDGVKDISETDEITHWLKNVELPTEEDIKMKLGHLEPYGTTFIAGAKYILSLLTPSHDPKIK